MSSVRRSHNMRGALGKLERARDAALTGGSKILQQRMQERAPLDTGRMTRSVTVSEVEAEPLTGRAYVMVGPTVDYSIYTELEPWIIGKRPGPKSQAKGASIPWIRPAANDVRERVIAFVTTALRAAVKGL